MNDINGTPVFFGHCTSRVVELSKIKISSIFEVTFLLKWLSKLRDLDNWTNHDLTLPLKEGVKQKYLVIIIVKLLINKRPAKNNEIVCFFKSKVLSKY